MMKPDIFHFETFSMQLMLCKSPLMITLMDHNKEEIPLPWLKIHVLFINVRTTDNVKLTHLL